MSKLIENICVMKERFSGHNTYITQAYFKDCALPAAC
jgi:hypothetical protein